MTLTDTDVQKVLNLLLNSLRELNAREVLDGIDETRRIGIEEQLIENKGSDIGQVARIRQRPPNDREMLNIVMARLVQRLLVLPRLADSIEKRLGSNDVQWRVDTEFSSVDRFPDASLQDLRPRGVEVINDRLRKIESLLGNSEDEASDHGNS